MMNGWCDEWVMGDDVYSWFLPYEHTLDITPCTPLVVVYVQSPNLSDCALVNCTERTGAGFKTMMRTKMWVNSHTSNCRHFSEDILWYVGEVIVVQEETSQSRDASEHVWSQKCQAIATQVPVKARQWKLQHKLLTGNIHKLDSDSQCTYVLTETSTALYSHRHT